MSIVSGGQPFTPRGPVTRRENVRINRGMGTQQGLERTLMQHLLSSEVQPAERQKAMSGE